MLLDVQNYWVSSRQIIGQYIDINVISSNVEISASNLKFVEVLYQIQAF